MVHTGEHSNAVHPSSVHFFPLFCTCGDGWMVWRVDGKWQIQQDIFGIFANAFVRSSSFFSNGGL